jgi:hypothetical protein
VRSAARKIIGGTPGGGGGKSLLARLYESPEAFADIQAKAGVAALAGSISSTKPYLLNRRDGGKEWALVSFELPNEALAPAGTMDVVNKYAF